MRPSNTLRHLAASAVAHPPPSTPVPHLHSYITTSAPTPAQLATASQTFTAHPPSFLFSASSLRSFPPDSPLPEVVFLGRSNVGKSSLLNALLGQPQQEAKFARVSRKPGKTRCLNVFGVGGAQGGTRTAVKAGMSAALLSKAREGGKHHSPAGRRNRDDDGTRSENYISGGSGSSGSSIVVVDCPGYGFGSRDAWGTEVLKYLRTRRQLRRAFLLISPEHGVKRSDLQVLELLHSLGTPHQIVLSKIDKILYPRGAPKNAGEPLDPKNVEALQDICAEVRKTVVADRRGTVLEDIICTSAEVPGWNGEIRMGIDGLRYEICRAAGLHAGALGKTEKREWRERLTISPTEASGMDALQAAMR